MNGAKVNELKDIKQKTSLITKNQYSEPIKVIQLNSLSVIN
jgi:hypothetical protein